MKYNRHFRRYINQESIRTGNGIGISCMLLIHNLLLFRHDTKNGFEPCILGGSDVSVGTVNEQHEPSKHHKE